MVSWWAGWCLDFIKADKKMFLGIDIFSLAGRIAPIMFTKSFPRSRRPFPLLTEKADFCVIG